MKEKGIYNVYSSGHACLKYLKNKTEGCTYLHLQLSLQCSFVILNTVKYSSKNIST